jgi:Skp family chaperone for outer membrane proteins
MFCAGSLIVALAALAGAGRLWAESKEQKPAKAPQRTRVALVNLTHVIKNYKRYGQFRDEMKRIAAPFQERDQKLRAQAEKLNKAKGNSPIIPAKSEDIDEKLKKIQREAEDNQVKAKKALSKKTDEDMKTIYMDIEEATKRYSASHDIDLVMHYNDAVTKEDYYSTPNIARKLQSGPLMPIYAAPGLDISQELVEILNASMKKD